jgi:DNA helicase-2/ATP-dependent DNA helicase PcrA
VRKRGPLRGAGKQSLEFEHVFVDEAQDLSPVELSVLLSVTTARCSVTLAGDTAQRLLMDNGFRSWDGVLHDLGLDTVHVEPLKIGYRSTMEVLAFARVILGPLADPEPPLATRQGAPVEFHGFHDVGAAVAFLGPRRCANLAGGAPRQRGRHRPRPRARRRVLPTAWSARRFRVCAGARPGLQLSSGRRGHRHPPGEGPGVRLRDPRRRDASQYPVDDESRHLLHIGATRAAHQLWVVAAGVPSPLLPAWMLDD